MKRALVLLLLFLISTLTAYPDPAPPAAGPLPPRVAAVKMQLPEGFRAEVFAAEPEVVQPVSFCLDSRGRLFVAEALNYGEWKPTGKDRIIILEDRDGDGRADLRKVFYEGLNYVTGIEVGFGGVYVMSPPHLYFIPDRNKDDIPDGNPIILLEGFGYKESRHNLANGFTWGPDGWLYAGHGRTSPSDVGRPGTAAAERVHCDGGVYRVHPTRLVFENFADGTTNPWGVDFDDYGQCFVSNCVNPHLFHMIQGGHYEPWRNRASSQFAYERLPTIADHWHFPTGKPKEMRGETPETLAMGGGHAHCGTLVYLGDSFPQEFRNTVLMCNVHGKRVNHDLLRRKGSGYTASHGKDFLIAADPWFMGVTLRTGPDGSVFLSDWSDTGECHTYRPQATTGRIYKISYGQPRKPSGNLAVLSDAELVRLQLHSNDWYVRHARRLLQERSTEPHWDAAPVHAALREQLAAEKHAVPQRLRALWALHVTGGLDSGRLLALTADRSEHVRAWAVQLLCEQETPSPEALTRFAVLAENDPSPVVRLYLASALQRLPLTMRWPIAQQLVAHAEDAGDANLPLLYWYGIEPLIPADPRRGLALAAQAKIPLVRQVVARRMAEDAVSQGKRGSLQPLVEALASTRPPVQLDLLTGTRAGLRGRKSTPMPQGWPALYAQLARSPEADLREQATLLALVFGDPQAFASLLTTVQTATLPASRRIAALEALLERRPSDLPVTLHELLADDELRRTALRGLAHFSHPDTPRKVLARYPRWTPEEKQDAVATLASRKEFALPLLDAVAAKEVARADLSAYVARQLHALGDRAVTERLREVWGEVRDNAPQKREQLARYKAMLTPGFLKRADLGNGRLVYTRTCQQCHILFGEGGKIGPDLTGSNRSDLDYVLSNLIDPAAEIGRDYRMSVVATRNGRVLTGLIVERTPARLVLQTATEQVTLAREEVEEVKDSAQSLMPERQLDTLTKEQIRDLIAYLASKHQVPLPAGK